MSDIFSGVQPGDILVDEKVTLVRDNLVRYAGASLDFNPIHYRDDVANEVGLPGVLAHGMLTMGVASSIVENFLAGAGWVSAYQVRFTKPVVVDRVLGAEIRVIAKLKNLSEKNAEIDLEVTFEDKKVLGKSTLQVSLF